MQPAHVVAMNKAKIDLMTKKDSVFFTTVCFSLKHVWDDRIPTAATNGIEVRYNPDFFLSLNKEEQVFLMLHEAMHVAYLHMDRLHTRDRRRFNIAADHVINLQLIDRGFQMPQGGLADPQYSDLSTEEVYKLLEDAPTADMDVMLDLQEPPESADGQDVVAQVQDILVRASLQSAMAGEPPGTIPGEIQIFINNLLNPKLPWQQILRKYLYSTNKSDYSFRRPNRRFFPEHYLPSLYSESLMDIAVAVDASGSVSDEDFNSFVTETHSILKTMNPESIHLVQFDTHIRTTAKVKSVQELMQVEFRGRGGTDIEPVIEWAQENRPKLLLVFTDGEFRFYSKTEPGMPVIWLIHNNPTFQAPYGKVIHYELV